VILVSWGIAFFDYCFQVPANRIGSYQFNALQLKTIQEIITLSIFPVLSMLYLGDKFKWNHTGASHLSWLRRFSFFTSGRLCGENRARQFHFVNIPFLLAGESNSLITKRTKYAKGEKHAAQGIGSLARRFERRQRHNFH
jgi:hypothetical protein